MIRTLVVAATWLAVSCNSGDPQAIRPRAQHGERAPAESHGFPLQPSFTHVCDQSVTAPQGSVQWSLYASPVALDAVSAWYRSRLPAAALERLEDTFLWRLPSRDAPEHALHLYPPGHAGMPDCGAVPPTGSRTLANISTMTR